MSRWLSSLFILGLIVSLSGCLTTPVERTGGPGSITIPNTNAAAILTASRSVFARYGYTAGPGRFPDTISFQRPAGRTGELMFGSYNTTTTFRLRMNLIPIAGSRDFRVTTQLYRVNNAGRAGFERETAMMRSWSSQFNAILRDVRAEAANFGRGL